jgi:hypothetical protein
MRVRVLAGLWAVGSLTAAAHAGLALNLVNPGAEVGTGVDAGSTVTGWTAGGDSNPGRDDGSFGDGFGPHSGSYDFYGGTGAMGTLSQTVSLSSLDPATLALIDTGTDSLNVEFFEQSLDQGVPSDSAEVKITFADAGGNPLAGGYDSGLIYNIGSWEDVTGSALIPAGTRMVNYEMIFTREVGSDLDSFIDDNSASVGTPTSPPPPSPPASVPMPAAAYTGIPTLGLLAGALWLRRRANA